jgi:hypothetical protein
MNIALFRIMKSFNSGRQALGMGGGEEFSTIAREMARRGHRVTVYCEVARTSRDDLLEWGLRLKPDAARLDDDENCLIVDNGAGINLLWAPNQLVLPRRLARFYQLVSTCDVPIFYSQSDPAVSMAIVTEIDDWLKLPSKVGVLEYITVPERALDGKQVIVMFTQHWPDEFATKIKSRYVQMAKHGMKYEHLDLSPTALIGRERQNPKQDPEYDIVYVGNSRRRKRLIPYVNRPDAHVWGQWSDRVRADQVPLATMHGKVGVHLVPGVYHDGRMTFVVRDDHELGFNARPTRIFESVQAGCPTWVDAKTFREGSEPYWPWLIEHADIDARLDEMRDPNRRRSLVGLQQDLVSSVDPLQPIDDLEAILEKHLR